MLEFFEVMRDRFRSVSYRGEMKQNEAGKNETQFRFFENFYYLFYGRFSFAILKFQLIICFASLRFKKKKDVFEGCGGPQK